jgi:hypothetical protein
MMTRQLSVLDVQFDRSGSVTVRGSTCAMQLQTLAPRVLGVEDASLQFRSQTTHEDSIGPIGGQTTVHIAAFAGCQVAREVFVSRDRRLVGIRISLTNQTSSALELQAMVPVSATGADTLQAAGATLPDWRIVRMSRQKNDVPGNFRFTDQDTDYEHAKIDGAEFKAGMGVQADDLATASQNATTVQADPFIWIKNRRDASVPGLFIGVLGQTEHLTQILLAANDDRTSLRSMAVRCEYDSVIIAPGQTRTTHWTLLWEEVDEETMRYRYIGLLADVMKVPTPGPSPSIFCSWYFYGTDFTQADLNENLAELRKRPIPFDVLLIDNGWMDDFGSYNAGPLFPAGMKHAANLIRAAGYRPGIWTCPFVIMSDSPALKKYTKLIARDGKGEPITFPYGQTKTWVVDPTSPDAEAYFAELFGKLRDWGFEVHKFDFLRAIVNAPQIRFHDRTMNRAQAYRHGMAMIRRMVGKDAYILACGGLFEGSAGLVNGIRVGADTKGRWGDPKAANAYHRMGYVVRIKQNVFRNHTNRLWHTDPDALQLRRRTEPFRNHPEFFHLCEGSFTDDEALTLVAHQYLGGGIACLCERMAEFPDDRYALLRRVLPSVTPPARIVDFENVECPSTFWTKVTPRVPGMASWATLVVFNWSAEPAEREVSLSSVPWLAACPRLAVMELATQTFIGVRCGQDSLPLTIPPHGTRILRLAPWDGQSPLLLGTDCHLSGGAAELDQLEISTDIVTGRVCSPWQFPIKLTIGMPVHGRLEPRSFTIAAGEREFSFTSNPAAGQKKEVSVR